MPAPPDLAARIQQLERELRELRLRVAELERRSNPRAENPDDQVAVRQKAVYDWQA